MLTVGCMKTLGFAQTHLGASFGEVPSDCRPKAFTPKQQAGGEYIFKQAQPFALKAEKAVNQQAGEDVFLFHMAMEAGLEMLF